MHKDHRSRVKNRFLAEGLDHFEPHNILELLLFYAIPQRDTNELAHMLINRFGSLTGVFDASVDELMTVPGIKEHSAILIKMIPSLARIYSIEKNKIGKALTSTTAWGEYFVNRYIGLKVETVFLLLLDNKFNVIDCVKLHEGDVNSASFSMRKMVEIIYAKNAPMVVLAHNHPSGIAIPSPEDLATTQAMMQSFRLLDIRLLGHIIVAGDQYIDILDSKNKVNLSFSRNMF
jgi:DNA repair protein RadC